MIYLKNITTPQEVWIPRQNNNIEAEHKDCYTEGYDDGFNDGYEKGTYEFPLQSKDVTVTGTSMAVTPDESYSGLSQVNIDAAQFGEDNYQSGYTDGKAEFKLQSKSYTVTGDTGNVTADEGYDGLSDVEVNAAIYGQEKYDAGHSAGYDEGYESGETAGYQSGYTEGKESVKIQSKSVDITGDTQTITPDTGYDAMSSVTANAGTYGEARYNEGYDKGVEDTTPILQYKSVVVDADEMEISPDEGYDALSRVDVDAVTYGKAKYEEGVASVKLQSKSVEVVANGEQTVSPDNGYSGMSAVTLNVNVPTGSTINNQDKTVELDLTGATATTAVTFDENYTGLGTVTVNADATDYGNARYEEGQASVSLQEKSVTLTQSGITSIVPDDGYSGMSSVSVNAPMQSYNKNIGGSDPDYWVVYPSQGYIGFNRIHLDIQDLRRQVAQEGIAQGQEQITRQIKDLEVSDNGTYTANTEGNKYLNFTGNSIYDLEAWKPTNSRICIATIRTYPDSEGIIISNHHNRWSSLKWDSTVYGINISNSGTVVEFKDCGLYASGTITTGIWHTLEFSKDSSTNELIAKIDDVLLPTSGTFKSDNDGNFTIGNTAVNVDWLNTKYNLSTTSTTSWNRDLIAQNDAEYRGIIAVVNENYRQVTPSNGNYAIYKDDAVYGWSSVTVNVPAVSPCNLQAKEVTYDANDTYQIVPDEDYDGLSAVTVTVNVPQTGSSACSLEFLTVTANGIYSPTVTKYYVDFKGNNNCYEIPGILSCDYTTEISFIPHSGASGGLLYQDDASWEGSNFDIGIRLNAGNVEVFQYGWSAITPYIEGEFNLLKTNISSTGGSIELNGKTYQVSGTYNGRDRGIGCRIGGYESYPDSYLNNCGIEYVKYSFDTNNYFYTAATQNGNATFQDTDGDYASIKGNAGDYIEISESEIDGWNQVTVNVPTTSVVTLTQAEYDDLDVKDNNTIYLIEG